MLKTLKSFIALKYSVFSFLFLGSFVFFLLSLYQKLDVLNYSFFKKLLFGTPILFFVRSFGIIINQIIDYDFDKKNPRTSNRTLPSKLLSIRVAYIYAVLNVIIFLIFSCYISFRCFFESCLASLFIIVYPYTKRFHVCCHFVLGCIYLFAVIIVGEVLLSEFNLFCFVYAIIVGLFISANDIIYSILDKEFDKQQSLFSFPSILGERASILTVYFCYGISFLLLIFLGFLSHFSMFYYVLLAFFFVTLIYLCMKLQATLNFSSKKFFSWEEAFFFSNVLISLSLFSLFIILFISKLK